MVEEISTSPLAIRLAMAEDIAIIDMLDTFSTSPTRHIHREMEKYFGSIDPSTHERNFIFLAEIDGTPAAKAELMLPPVETAQSVGYIKRVVVHPHQTSACGYPCIHAWGGSRRSLFGAGVGHPVWGTGIVPLPLIFFCSFTNQERKATQVKVRHTFTFAPCVKRLLVR